MQIEKYESRFEILSEIWVFRYYMYTNLTGSKNNLLRKLNV